MSAEALERKRAARIECEEMLAQASKNRSDCLFAYHKAVLYGDGHEASAKRGLDIAVINEQNAHALLADARAEYLEASVDAQVAEIQARRELRRHAGRNALPPTKDGER